MHPRLRRRVAARLLALSLVAAWLVPAAPALTAAEGDEAVLRVGTTQDLDAMNPYQTALVVGFEVFALNYELLVGWDQQLNPMPAFADSWEANEDQTEWTFHIPEGKLWSDGEPATAEDAVFSWQLILDGLASEAGSTCLGYLDAYLSNAGVTEVSAPDPQTFVVTLDRPNDRVLGTYVPIIPRHVWEEFTSETICDEQFDPPLVGSGPYQAQSWETGQSVTFARNPNWTTGERESGERTEPAAEELVLQFFENEDTMAQALQNNELDYAQNVLSDQFEQLTGQEDIETVAGTANGFTELGFNTYGTGTGNTIEGGGPSTPALLDAAFRDALGYAIDKELLVERVLGGYGEPGTTQVPPFQARWHTPPAEPRTFDLDEARRRLEAAGYVLDDQGQRLDKEGNPIVLDLVFPDSDTTYAASAEFITEWFGEVGVTVNSAQYDSDTLVDLMLPPEADGTADYDLFIWGWGGDVDPNSLLEIFTCDEIGNTSDSMYCNPRYDELFEQQNAATSPEERKALIDEMQEIFYEEAPYHILYYDAALHAYRTDRFTGWVNQPENGTPLFGYGPYGYLQLQLAGAGGPGASAAPSGGAAPTGGAGESGDPNAPGGGATPAPSGGQSGQPAAAGGVNAPLIAIVAIVALAVLGGLFLMRRRRPAAEEE